MMPNIVAKKIFKSAHHARRRIKNHIPMIGFVYANYYATKN